MSITLTPTKASYLERVAEGLSDPPAEDREEVLQDLEAHLAELDDADIQRTLGDPDSFVTEFRATAGLDEPYESKRWEIPRALGERYHELSARLSSLTRWPTIRPGWVLVRGWLLVVAWSFLYDFEQFSRFPIPSIGSSSLTGLFFVVLATVVSIWLDRGRGRVLRFASTTVSFLTVWGLIASFANTPAVETFEEIPYYSDQLVGPEGNLITNLFAYDLDGEPVEVLLFDQEGRPILSLPTWVYEEADAQHGAPIDWGSGQVIFQRDQFSRVIPNLYPLELSTYDETGRLVPVPPPSLGFPAVEDEAAPTETVNRVAS